MARRSGRGGRQTVGTAGVSRVVGADARIGCRFPSDFEKPVPYRLASSRIRRGPLSATVVLGGSSRLLTMRSWRGSHGGCALRHVVFRQGTVRSARGAEKRGRCLSPSAGAGGPGPSTLAAERSRPRPGRRRGPTRRQSEINQLEQVSRDHGNRSGGFQGPGPGAGDQRACRWQSRSCFRAGGQLEGCDLIPGQSLTASCSRRGWGVYRAAKGRVRFGPGAAPHKYVQVRGAEECGRDRASTSPDITPFDRTLTFQCI